MVKHARLQPSKKKSFGYHPFVSLAKAETHGSKEDLIPGFQSLPHTPLQLSWLFSSSLSCMRQDILITCSLELDWGEGGQAAGAWGIYFCVN
jgi:hypothetical protein